MTEFKERVEDFNKELEELLKKYHLIMCCGKVHPFDDEKILFIMDENNFDNVIKLCRYDRDY